MNSNGNLIYYKRKVKTLKTPAHLLVIIAKIRTSGIAFKWSSQADKFVFSPYLVSLLDNFFDFLGEIIC